MKKTLTFLIWLGAFLDIFTFLFFRLPEFEANPIYLLTKSSFLMILFKLIVLGGVTYLLWSYKPKKRFVWAYTICFICIYAILSQFLGAYMNYSTHQNVTTSEPGTVVPLEPQKAVTQYTIIFGLLLYLPMFLAVLSFWFFERIYL